MLTDPEPASRDPQSILEKALIDEFLAERGCTLQSVSTLPPAKRDSLLRGATAFAALKLAEIEARARFVDEID